MRRGTSVVSPVFVGGIGAVVAEVLSETALPRMLDDEVVARAYGLVLPAAPLAPATAPA